MTRQREDVRTPFSACAFVFAFVCCIGTGCAASHVRGQQPSADADRVVAPVTYTGDLPCADCPGIQLTVTLFPDSTFRLRRLYQERPVVFHSTGRWSVGERGTQLVLRSGDQTPQRFQITGADSLRMLDARGQPIHSPFNDWLIRAPQVDSLCRLR